VEGDDPILPAAGTNCEILSSPSNSINNSTCVSANLQSLKGVVRYLTLAVRVPESPHLLRTKSTKMYLVRDEMLIALER